MRSDYDRSAASGSPIDRPARQTGIDSDLGAKRAPYPWEDASSDRYIPPPGPAGNVPSVFPPKSPMPHFFRDSPGPSSGEWTFGNPLVQTHVMNISDSTMYATGSDGSAYPG